jgi:hypothetical protein
MATPNYPEGKHAYEECSGVGACDTSTGICNCATGYTGIGCRRTTCPNDCSGNGICLVGAEIAPQGYGGDKLLQYQKKFWDADKSTQCLCDSGYIGVDCSVRICPSSFVNDNQCDENPLHHSDVQAITLSFTNTLTGMEPVNFDNYFSMQFTDQFNAQVATRPISFWDDAFTVQQALYALPGFAVLDVQVTKIWPLQEYDALLDPDSYVSGSTLETANIHRSLACETWYYGAFLSTSCSSDADCGSKFGLTGGTNVLCESNTQVCFETDISGCQVDDGINEFNNDLCAENFQPDGIYFSTTIGAAIWGRRLTSADRKCHIGLFASDDTDFAIACTSNSDCVPCASPGISQVRAGECVNNVCVPSPTFTSDFVTAELEECSTTAFLLQFDGNRGGSRKSNIKCNIGPSTNIAGASPKYESNDLATCTAKHIGLPEWRISEYSESVNSLCWSKDTGGTGVATNEFIAPADVAAYETAGGFCYDFDSGTESDITLVVEDQNAIRGQDINDDSSLSWPSNTGFNSNSIAEIYEMDYAFDLPCSNKGTCFEETGLCECGEGYSGAACEKALSYI